MDDCPYCGDPHPGRCRPQVGTMLAEARLLIDFDKSVADVLLRIADIETRVRDLERENREWH